MKATVDRSGCISCGACAMACPEVFRMDDEGLAEAYAPVEESLVPQAQEARDGCPVSVISLEE